MTGFIEISGRKIGPGFPAYVIAELSANHHQQLRVATRLIHEAKNAGADAVKIQTYTADSLTLDCRNRYFKIGGGTLWDGHTLYDLYKDAYTPWEWHPKLKKVAEKLGLGFFSSPFDFVAIDFLENLKMPAYKVASFEIVDLPLIQKMARTGKPIILSTGMASFKEIADAVKAAREVGAKQIALLKCCSAYPAPSSEMNIKTITHMQKAFKVPVGISDHTLGIEVPVSAVALGACIVEKHFILSRKEKGPDNAFSLEPVEFAAMVKGIRIAEKAVGKVQYGPTAHEKSSLPFRRSLFVVESVTKGEVLTAANVRSIRPAHGLPPKYLPEIVGRRAQRNIKRGTPLKWDHLAPKR